MLFTAEDLEKAIDRTYDKAYASGFNDGYDAALEVLTKYLKKLREEENRGQAKSNSACQATLLESCDVWQEQ